MLIQASCMSWICTITVSILWEESFQPLSLWRSACVHVICALRCVCGYILGPISACVRRVFLNPFCRILTMLHIIIKGGEVLLQVANESSFLTSLNGPDKKSNEEINNSAIVVLLILIDPGCWGLGSVKRGPFLLCSFCTSAGFKRFFPPPQTPDW